MSYYPGDTEKIVAAIDRLTGAVESLRDDLGHASLGIHDAIVRVAEAAESYHQDFANLTAAVESLR